MKANLKSELKKVLKHAPVYSLGNILSSVAGFLLIPVYTRFFSPADYGILQLVVLTSDTFGIFVGLKISETMIRIYFESEDPEQRKLIISTGLINVLLVCILIIIPLVASGNILAKIILDDVGFGYLFRIAFIGIIFNVLAQIPFAYMQIREKSLLFIVLSISKLIVAISLNIYFVVFLKIGVLGIVLSTLITSLLYFIITVPYLLKQIGLRYSWKWSKQILRFGLPYIPSTLADRVTHHSDRYFLRYYLSLSDVGIYSLGYRIGSIIHNVFNVSLFRILNVRILAIHKSENAPEIIARMATYTTIFLFFIGLGLSVFAKDIIMIMVPVEFWDAYKIIPPICLCYIIFSLENYFVQPMLILKKTERLFYVNIATAIINISMNYLLISAFGIYGAILATFLSLVFKELGFFFIGKGLFPIPYEWKRLSSIVVAALILYLLSESFSDLELYLRLLCNIALWLSFVPLLWVSGIINGEEKKEVGKILKLKVMPYFLGK